MCLWHPNIPNRKYILTFSMTRPLKLYPNWDFRNLDKPTGNPGGGRRRTDRKKARNICLHCSSKSWRFGLICYLAKLLSLKLEHDDLHIFGVCRTLLLAWVARWYIFRPQSTILVYVCRPWSGKISVYFMPILVLLSPFGVCFTSVRYI
jgi:hypothetical protein